ncbi:MAG: hypothetical protein JO202_04155 [Ktedonobacteraceae bacterium]|nr:hypothetical protein [Ktedonobacteraceae bacterium]
MAQCDEQKEEDNMLNKDNSEIARFREQQALEDQAAWLGLHGLAWGTARHDSILKHVRQGTERILRLLDQDKYQDVQRLMTTDPWGREVRRVKQSDRRAKRKEGPHGQAHSGA